MRDVVVKAALAQWESPLRKWFDVLDRYRAANGSTDAAYWYNERATLSTVAGALWLSGHLVLEEYTTRRGGNGPNAGVGRTDMWCRIDTEEYTVEAKQDVKLSYPATAKSLASWASTQLTWATTQCQTDNFGVKNRLAMVFMVPRLLTVPLEKTIKEWTAAVADVDVDIKAHYLTTAAPRSLVNQRYFPGVILLANLVPCQAPGDQ